MNARKCSRYVVSQNTPLPLSRHKVFALIHTRSILSKTDGANLFKKMLINTSARYHLCHTLLSDFSSLNCQFLTYCWNWHLMILLSIRKQRCQCYLLFLKSFLKMKFAIRCSDFIEQKETCNSHCSHQSVLLARAIPKIYTEYIKITKSKHAIQNMDSFVTGSSSPGFTGCQPLDTFRFLFYFIIVF